MSNKRKTHYIGIIKFVNCKILSLRKWKMSLMCSSFWPLNLFVMKSILKIIIYPCVVGLVAQAVRRSPPTAGVPSSRLGPTMWVSWWTKRGLGRFFTGFLPFSPTTNFIPPFLHTHLIHFVSFHPPLDGASGVVGRHPCYSRTYNIGASSHLIPRPDLMLDTSWGYLYILMSLNFYREIFSCIN